MKVKKEAEKLSITETKTIEIQENSGNENVEDSESFETENIPEPQYNSS